MKKVICVSQKNACVVDFMQRVREIFLAEPFAFILREKELLPTEYEDLAKEIYAISIEYKTPFFLNGNVKLAEKMGIGVQIPFTVYKELAILSVPVGISIHSLEEAEYIVNTEKDIKISHIIAGHIFATDCKKGLAPRGVEFLTSICNIIPKTIPVFGIGGIGIENAKDIYASGAYGCAIMSSCMKTKNVQEFLYLLTQ